MAFKTSSRFLSSDFVMDTPEKGKINYLEKYEQEKASLHQAVGECIMTWSHVELHTSILMTTLIKGQPLVGETVWNSVVAFKAKVSTTTNLVNLVIKDKQLLQIWTKIALKLGDYYAVRNKVAHATVVAAENKGRAKRLYLVPYWANGKDIKKLDRMTEKELGEWTDKFHNLGSIIGWFDLYYRSLSKPALRAHQLTPDLVLQRLGRDDLSISSIAPPPQS